MSEASPELFLEGESRFYFYIYENVTPGAYKSLAKNIIRHGGRVTDDPLDKRLDIVIFDENDASTSRTKLLNSFANTYTKKPNTPKRPKRNEHAEIENLNFVKRCIEKRRIVSYTREKEKPMPGRKIGSQRQEYTKEDDEYLANFIARRIPDKNRGGRQGNTLYKELVSDPVDRPWAARHSWESWRNRYKKHPQAFDQRIKEIAQTLRRRHGSSFVEKLQDPRNAKFKPELVQESEDEFDEVLAEDTEANSEDEGHFNIPIRTQEQGEATSSSADEEDQIDQLEQDELVSDGGEQVEGGFHDAEDITIWGQVGDEPTPQDTLQPEENGTRDVIAATQHRMPDDAWPQPETINPAPNSTTHIQAIPPAKKKPRAQKQTTPGIVTIDPPYRNTRARSRSVEQTQIVPPHRRTNSKQKKKGTNLETLLEGRNSEEEDVEDLLQPRRSSGAKAQVLGQSSKRRPSELSSDDDETKRAIQSRAVRQKTSVGYASRPPFRTTDAEAIPFEQAAIPSSSRKKAGQLTSTPLRSLSRPLQSTPQARSTARKPPSNPFILTPGSLNRVPSTSTDASFPLHGTLARTARKTMTREKKDLYKPPPSSKAAKLRRKVNDDDG